MKYAKYLITIFILAVLVVVGFMARPPVSSVQTSQSKNVSSGHIYSTWETTEFDKCVAAWLIIRFIDKDAKFVSYPQGIEITEGIQFDVPGADWSRKHLKCTSQCILETINNPDPAMKRIVSFAARTELNFWQLDSWPQAQKCFYDVKEIMEKNPDPKVCFEKTSIYFDSLYDDIKSGRIADPNI